MSEAVLDTTMVRRWKRRETLQRMPFDWDVTIPADWKIHRLKEVADARPSNVDKKSQEGERAVRLCNYVDIYKNDLITEAIEFMDATASDSQIEQFGIQAGDVIITKDSEAWDDIAVPAYVPKTIKNLVCGYHLTLIRPEAGVLDGAYLARCIQAEGIADQFRVMANGITRYGIGTQGIRCAAIPVPPLSEQRAIAAFLDRETARIDALVAKKQRLIELLEEKRRAIISQIVTKGLAPSEKMIDSRISWLGSVPSHWTMTRVKFIVSEESGIQIGPFGGMLKELSPSPTGFKLYGQENTIGDDFGRGNRWLSESLFECLKSYELLSGDIVLTRKGSIGNCRVAPPGIIPGVIDSDTIRVRIDESKMLVEFAVLLLHEGYLEAEVIAMQKGAVLPGLNSTTIANLRIALPPIAEQELILEALKDKCKPIDSAIEKIAGTIDLLLEHRSSLISATVTGQIDVREKVRLEA